LGWGLVDELSADQRHAWSWLRQLKDPGIVDDSAILTIRIVCASIWPSEASVSTRFVVGAIRFHYQVIRLHVVHLHFEGNSLNQIAVVSKTPSEKHQTFHSLIRKRSSLSRFWVEEKNWHLSLKVELTNVKPTRLW
jgi:hypothetical protein